ncbi:DNA (cytosine-5-)-methyltransferase, partial [Clostridiaceae bacterium HSG29]|nr:DNA (cytosine-5-)-methyltransferase [Clostridiaceae bacterium HSG29]
VIYCIGKHKINDFKKSLKEYYCGFTEERTVFKGRIINKRLMELCLECGKGAINKKIPSFIMDLPLDLLDEFLNGYMSGDGCYNEVCYSASSISRKLIYQLGQVVVKLYNTPYSIYFVKRPKKTIIEGRTVNQNDTWSISFNKEKRKQNNGVFLDENVYLPFKSKELIINNTEYVFNFEVEEDNSYVANNCIVHNCQSFSVAGKQAGGDEDSGTNSSLMWETVRIIEKLNPKFILWENVKNVLSKKHKHNFDKYVSQLDELGYNSYWQVLNTKDYGLPQNRERVFCLSIKKELDKGFEFPAKQELKLRLKDMLEKEVDEKYYLKLNNYVQKKYKEFTEEKEYIPELFNPYNKSEIQDISPTQTTQCGSTTSSATVLKKEPKIIKVGQLESSFEQSGRVHSPEGISPTVMGNSHGNTSGGYNATKILNGFRIRKLTPKECWRLQGFSDEQFTKAAYFSLEESKKLLKTRKRYKTDKRSDGEYVEKTSSSQLYKQAGNSISVTVLEVIFKQLVKFGYINNN